MPLAFINSDGKQPHSQCGYFAGIILSVCIDGFSIDFFSGLPIKNQSTPCEIRLCYSHFPVMDIERLVIIEPNYPEKTVFDQTFWENTALVCSGRGIPTSSAYSAKVGSMNLPVINWLDVLWKIPAQLVSGFLINHGISALLYSHAKNSGNLPFSSSRQFEETSI